MPILLLLPLDGQRTRFDLPFLSLKEEQMRHDLRQTAFNLPQIELDLWQIVAHPPQTKPCLRFISFHGG